jgi:small ligand-binding sensory domain FIST
MALALAAAQLDAQIATRRQGPDPDWSPTLGWLYFTDHHAAQAEALLADAQARWPGVALVGSVGVGVMADGVEYFDEPALALMLCNLPRTDFRLFSGRLPLLPGPLFDPWTAQVHADPSTPDLAELISEAAQRTGSHYLFGGLASARTRTVLLADGVFEGGLAGVAFGPDVGLVSRVTQGCQPVGPARRVTAAHRNVIETLDGERALGRMLADLGLPPAGPTLPAQRLAGTLVGLTHPNDSALARGGQFGADTRVRHLVGVDPARQAIAIADHAELGSQLTFCRRDAQAARRDLVRICTEIRDEVEAGEPVAAGPGEAAPASRMAGTMYVSCTGRGGPHFGSASAEAQTVRHALGDVPFVGFFAAGEVARHHLYGYTGVLTVFLNPV